MDESVDWKPIPGWEHYQVSNNGEIKNHKGYILKPYKNKWGYPIVTLCKNGNKTRKAVHRIVCLAFIGDPGNLDVNHKNKIKTDNCLSNLEYLTKSENEFHSWQNGKKPHRSSAKITTVQAEEIRNRRVSGEKGKDIAMEYGISEQSVCGIYKGRSWRDGTC